MTFSVETGASYRDFGFMQNESAIPYISIPAALRVRLGKGFFKINVYGGAEFNRLYTPMYRYPAPGNPTNTSYNLFLHQNDAITAMYGVGVLLGGKGFNFEIFSERIYQIDTYDLQYGKTIGGNTLGASIQILLF